MIGHVQQAVSILLIKLFVPGVVAVERGGIGLAGGDVAHRIPPRPGVAGVKGARVHVAAFPFGQQEHRLDGAQIVGHLIPVVLRHKAGGVEAVTIDTGFLDPEAQRARHVSTQAGRVVVEFDNIVPVEPWGRAWLALAVLQVPIRVILANHVVPRRMVAHPVKDHMQAEPVRRGDELLEVGHGAQFGIDGEIIVDRVRATQLALAMLLADRVNRHQPDNGRAQLLEARQLALGCAQRAFRRKLARIDLVNTGVLAPLRMRERRGLGSGKKAQRKEQGEAALPDGADRVAIHSVWLCVVNDEKAPSPACADEGVRETRKILGVKLTPAARSLALTEAISGRSGTGARVTPALALVMPIVEIQAAAMHFSRGFTVVLFNSSL